MRIAIYIRYVLFASLVFVLSFSAGNVATVRATERTATSSSTTQHTVEEKKQNLKQDIDQYSIVHNVVQGHSNNTHFGAKGQFKQFLLAHYLSYLRHAPVFTSFTTVSKERNNFYHLFPRLLIFPNHWFG